MRKSKTIIMLMALIFVLAAQVMAEPVAEKVALDIQGDDLFIDTDKQIIEFTGNVLALYEDMTIISHRLLWDRADDSLDISGDVQLTGGKLEGTAQKVFIDLQKKLVTLTGDVQMNWDGQLIKGSVVTYDLETKILKATNANVKIKEIGK